MPTTGLVVRPVRWEDFSGVREIYWELYDERDAGEPIGITLFAVRPSVEDEVQWFAGVFAKVLAGHTIYLVAEQDGQVVGGCTVTRAAPGPSSEQAHVGELGILVRRGFRGRGVGAALLEAAISEARRKFELVYLSVFSVNTTARRLYERFGFSVCGHLPRVVKRRGQYFDEERMVLVFPAPAQDAEENR